MALEPFIHAFCNALLRASAPLCRRSDDQHRDALRFCYCLRSRVGDAARSSGYAAAVSHTLGAASPGFRDRMEFRHDVFTWFEQLGALDRLVSHWPGNLLHIQPLS